MKASRSDKAFNVFLCIFWIIVVVLAVLPIIYIINVSLSSKISVNSGNVFLLPIDASLNAYKNIFSDGQIVRALLNSAEITLVGTLLSVCFAIICAYPISKRYLPGRRIVIGMILFTMFFRGGLIPNVVLMRGLGITNTYWSVWLASHSSVYNIFVLKTGFESIPKSYEESARIDGASDLTILLKIYLPLSIPVLIAITLFYMVSWWNEYYFALIFIHASNKLPIVIKVQQLVENMGENLLNLTGEDLKMQQTIAAASVKSACIMICMLPILLISLPLQKYYIKGNFLGVNKE